MSVLLKDILAVKETVKALVANFCLIGVSDCGREKYDADRKLCGGERMSVEKLTWDDCRQRMVLEALMVRIRYEGGNKAIGKLTYLGSLIKKLRVCEGFDQ